MTTFQEKELKKCVKTILDTYPDIVNKYRDGQRGLIGFIMKKVIKESDMSFYSKESKQKLVHELKKQLN